MTAGEHARVHYERTFEGSTLSVESVDEYPKFSFDELTLGKVLGKGGFGTVSEVKAFKVDVDPKHEYQPKEGEEYPEDIYGYDLTETEVEGM
jgi:hypothetical protein